LNKLSSFVRLLLSFVHGLHEREGLGWERGTLLPPRLVLHALRNLSLEEKGQRGLRNWGEEDQLLVEEKSELNKVIRNIYHDQFSSLRHITYATWPCLLARWAFPFPQIDMTRNDFAQIRQLTELFMDQNNNQFNSNLILPKSHLIALNTKKIRKRKQQYNFGKSTSLQRSTKRILFWKRTNSNQNNKIYINLYREKLSRM